MRPVTKLVLSSLFLAMPLVAQNPQHTLGGARTTNRIGVSDHSGNAPKPTQNLGAPEFDPNWTTAGLVLLIGGAVLLLGNRRRVEFAD